jgi:hypothetical protein
VSYCRGGTAGPSGRAGWSSRLGARGGAPVEVWFEMLWGRAELILRQPESSDAAPCNRSTPLILPSTWLLSSVHQPGSSPPASLGPRSHICIGSRAVIRPPCSLSSRRCAPVLLAGSTPRLVLCAVLRQDVMVLAAPSADGAWCRQLCTRADQHPHQSPRPTGQDGPARCHRHVARARGLSSG